MCHRQLNPGKLRFWAGPLEYCARRMLWESANEFLMPDPNTNRRAKSRVSVDSGGRVLLPKKIRQRLGLAAGDELDVGFPMAGLDHAGEDAILLRVVRPEVPWRRESKLSSLPWRRGAGAGGRNRDDCGGTRGAF
jgi:AbrB family looped-hinge helix DNA binding protein